MCNIGTCEILDPVSFASLNPTSHTHDTKRHAAMLVPVGGCHLGIAEYDCAYMRIYRVVLCSYLLVWVGVETSPGLTTRPGTTSYYRAIE